VDRVAVVDFDCMFLEAVLGGSKALTPKSHKTFLCEFMGQILWAFQMNDSEYCNELIMSIRV